MADTTPPTKTFYPAERNIYGRHGKLFVGGIGGASALRWLANVTEVSATMTIDRLEVRRSGDRFVRYKAGEVTGEGTLTMDYVNSDLSADLIKYINRSTADGLELPAYYLHMSLEDPGQPGIEYDEDGFATKGHEEIVLETVNFWSIPFGFSLSDMVTRDLDFTFQGVDFGGDAQNPHKIVDPIMTLPPSIT